MVNTLFALKTRNINGLLSKAFELAGLHLDPVIVVNDIVVRLKTTIMEVLALVGARVNVVRERIPGDASAAVLAGHVVEDGI